MELSVPMEPVTNSNPLERLEAPPMLYKPSSPVEVTVVENVRLTPEDYSEEIRHIVLDLKGTDYRYLEGQSMGVIAPGEDERGKPHRVRLYSIASPAMGEPDNPSHVALCVKRVVFEEGQETFYGLCSNYLCDVKPGDKVTISGPNGKRFVMPRDPDVDLLLFAAGTGIAPFASLIREPEVYEKFEQVILTHTCREVGELQYGKELIESIRSDEMLEELIGEGFHEKLRYYPTTTREESPRMGRITDLMRSGEGFADLGVVPLAPETDRAMVCGNLAFNLEIKQMLEEYGLREGANSDPGEYVVEKAFLD